MAHRASHEAARRPRRCPEALGRDLERHADDFETFEIWHVRTSKYRPGDILRILRIGALNNGFLTIGVG